MEYKQLSIWSKEEMNIFAPRMKSKKEIKLEKRELFKRKILERAVLSDEEKEKYNFPLVKKELKNIVEYHNQECLEKYNYSKDKITDRINYHLTIFNDGTPQMVLTSLSQYSKKEQKDLLVSDLVVMYQSINNAFLEKKQIDTKKFRKANNLTFFGCRQHTLMEEYIASLK
jgi:hypothetical protein